jgi:(p)ppGpp synthase/HD superfamily hydrolase
MMINYSDRVFRAIKFSIKTHDVYQKQKRKGKEIAYITHPLSVGIILSLAHASEDVIVAGILHDTIEDSIAEKKVSEAMLTERFGANVTRLVLSVTESDKAGTWEERKREAMDHILVFDNDSLLLKSADVLANTRELIDDHARYGDQVFERFAAPKERLLWHYIETIGLILSAWPDNPLANELRLMEEGLKVNVS